MTKPISLKNISTLDDLRISISKYARNKTSVVMFTASWCGPCKNIKRDIYDENGGGLSVEYRDVVFFYVDIDDNPEIAAEFSISSVPCFYFIKVDGSELEFVHQKISGGSRSKLADALDSIN